MGATTFSTIGKGKDAKEAFRNAREEAAYDHGHAGYTGTIAEKNDFTLIPSTFALVPSGKNDSPPLSREDVLKQAYDLAKSLLDEEDPRVNDKWGPAGCINLGDGEFLFFGWASC